MVYVVLYVVMVVTFLALDALMLGRVIKPVFQEALGDMLLDGLRYGPALAFYSFFVVGLVYFAALPGMRADSALVALGLGAFIGALAYGTYEFTNLSTLEPWTWKMVALDLTWGTVLSGVTAATGVIVTRWLGYSLA